MDQSPEACRLLDRRSFLTSSVGGLGLPALASLLQSDGLLNVAGDATRDPRNPLAPQAPHFPPRAKNAIFIFLEGGPSQVDLFDPKPLLNERHQQKLPESFLQDVEFAF